MVDCESRASLIGSRGSLVAGSHFAVTFKMDVTFKPQAKRFKLEEVAVYQLSDGKIVYDQFFYSM
jgi:hypothetical protein